VKRAVICLLIAIAIVGFCVHAYQQIDSAREQVHAYARLIFAAIEEEDGPAARQTAQALDEYWKKERQNLVIFFRNEELDEVSRAIAKLTAHAAADEFADVDAELRTTIWQVDHIWQGERVRIRSIL